MKVTHVIDSGGYYGAETFLTNLCRCQIDLGIDVEVISIGKPNPEMKPLEKELESKRIPYIPWRMHPFPDPRESLKLLRFFKEGHTNIVHSHGYKGNILLALLPKSARKIPVITTVHGYTSSKTFSKLRLYQFADKLLLKRLDAVVLVSEAVKHQVYENIIEKKLFVIRNGIPSKIPASASDKLAILGEDYFNISAIGRLSEEKNFKLLISAMPKIVKEIPNAKLVIFGEGPLRNSLESLVNEMKLSDRVFLPGFIDEPSRVYRQSNVIVNCSTTEGMPISLLEAIREGCPFIASDIPANAGLAKDLNLSNQLFRLDKESLAKKLLELYNSSADELTELKQKMKNEFYNGYTIEKTAMSYIELYQFLAKSDNEGAYLS